MDWQHWSDNQYIYYQIEILYFPIVKELKAWIIHFPVLCFWSAILWGSEQTPIEHAPPLDKALHL